MRRNQHGLWVVLAITIFVLFFNLGTIPLLDPDEPVYAETPKEMLAAGDLVSPRIYGDYWYDKPPMYYWLVAGSFSVFGVNEFAARFPSAVAALLCVAVVYHYGSRMFNGRVGLLSALVLATSVEFFYLGKAAVTDATLNLFLTVALLGFLRRQYYVFYIAAALATVTKGPIGFLFPGGIVFFYMLVTRQWGLLRQMKILPGILLYAAIACPWYVAMYAKHGQVFIDTFFGFHNVTRFTSPEHPELVLWYYYLPVLMVGLLPWTAVLVQSLWGSLQRSASEWNRLMFLQVWFWLILIFFTISRTKLVSYILPLYPAAALLIGWYIDDVWENRLKRSTLSWQIAGAALSLAFAMVMVVGAWKGMPALLPAASVGGGIFVLLAIATVYFLRKKDIQAVVTSQVLSICLFVIVLFGFMFPAVAPEFTALHLVKDFKAVYDGQTPVYVIKFLRPGVSFYGEVYGREVKDYQELKVRLKEPGDAYYVVRKLDYKRLDDEERQMVERLSETGSTMILRKKAGN